MSIEDSSENQGKLRETTMSFKSFLKRYAPITFQRAQAEFKQINKKMGNLESASKRNEAALEDVSGKLDDLDNRKDGCSDIRAAINDVSWKMGKLFQKSDNRNLIETSALLPRKTIDFLDIRLVDHCNLNCIGCNAYSPLAQECYLDIDSFESDINRLHSLIGDRLIRLNLMGGEPLLHPNAESFAGIARSAFPESRINYTTNGLKVFSMPDSFWKALRDNDIELRYTRYPIDFDYDKMVEYVHSKGVNAIYSGGDKSIATFRRLPLNPGGFYNTKQMYVRCPYIDCTQLRNGKLFRCPPCAMSDVLNDALDAQGYSQRFKLSPIDYIDIHDPAVTAEEIFDYLSYPIPFCQYCNLNKEDFLTWSQSKRDITEWVDF